MRQNLILAAALFVPALFVPGTVDAADPPAAPAAQEITAVTVFGRLPKRVSETVRRLDSSRASSCAYFRSSGHADDLLDSYLDHFHGSKRTAENHTTGETDLEGRYINNNESFRDTSPSGDASTTPSASAVVTDTQAEERDHCGTADRNSAAGRNYIARKDKTMDAAYAAYDKGDFATAMAAFKTAYAKLGMDAAALLLGDMYLYGQGTPQNVKEAVLWYEKLANSRLSKEQYSVYNPAEPERATAKVEAQLRLAKIYRSGFQVPADPARARRLYQDAVDLNHIPAHAGLAGMLLSGYGGPKDPARAVALLTTAAEHGYAGAQSTLAAIYRNGAGVPQDAAKAFAWYQQAAFNPRPDRRKPHAQYVLATMYDEGAGVAADPAKALALYKLSAVAGHPDAQNALATYFYEGQMVKKDDVIARKLFVTAATQGQPGAMFNAAIMMFKGEGGSADLVQSYAWLLLASKLGHEPAKPAVAVVEARLTPGQKDQARSLVK